MQVWANALRDVVTPEGLVDYDRLEDRREDLEGYVAWLGTGEAWQGRLTRDFHGRYLNAYNALVMYQVLERGRPASVRDPRRLIPAAGAAFFLETQFKLGPDWLSLSEIEHERLRLKEMDIRDHAALNCASMSCPPLLNELYRSQPRVLSGQLDEQMTRWVMDDRALRFEGEKLFFNPIFEWYSRDFRFWSAGLDLCSITAEYASGKRRKKLERAADLGCPHAYFEYDWSLNEAREMER